MTRIMLTIGLYIAEYLPYLNILTIRVVCRPLGKLSLVPLIAAIEGVDLRITKPTPMALPQRYVKKQATAKRRQSQNAKARQQR